MSLASVRAVPKLRACICASVARSSSSRSRRFLYTSGACSASETPAGPHRHAIQSRRDGPSSDRRPVKAAIQDEIRGSGGAQPAAQKGDLRINVVTELERRGFVAAMTGPELRDHVRTPTCVYAGVDPSAESLHVGNLLPLMGLLHFWRSGHKALALIGGATGSIGDPSGRSTERDDVDQTVLNSNIRSITFQVEQFFTRAQEYISRREPKSRVPVGSYEVHNNMNWTRDVTLLDFLRSVGKMSRVNVMLARDSVKNRLESGSGISFTEFSYQLLQAYDFAHLHERHGCRIQLGGSDQWGNIVAGVDLIKRRRQDEIRRALRADSEHPWVQPGKRERGALEAQAYTQKAPLDRWRQDERELADKFGANEAAERERKFGREADAQAWGITIPLLLTKSGAKFGKSAGNAVWLSDTLTSPSQFYQYFLGSADEEVEEHLLLFTLLPVERISQVMREHNANPQARIAQRLLAEEVTELVHGLEGVANAKHVAKALFHTNLNELDIDATIHAFKGSKELVYWNKRDMCEVNLSKLFLKTGFTTTRAEAARLIRGGGVTVNGRKIIEPGTVLRPEDLLNGRLAIVKAGTKRHMIIVARDKGAGAAPGNEPVRGGGAEAASDE